MEPFSFRRSRDYSGIIAEADECLEDGTEVFSTGGRKDSWHVFKDGVTGVSAMCCTPHFSDNANRLKEEAAAFAFVDTGLLASNTLVLTRRTKCDDINRRDLSPIDVGHITQMLQMRETAGGNCNGIGFDFRGPNRFNAIEDACQFKAAAAGELRAQLHASTSRSSKTIGIACLTCSSSSDMSARISG